MSNEQQLPDNENSSQIGSEPDAQAAEDSSSGGEFKLTIRKLELPVRPRGVLAD
jgi:hypothetical protein